MPKFSKKSLDLLKQCDPRLQELCKRVIEVMDISIIVAYRGKSEQDKAFHEGKSKLKYPKSKHNILPSKAVDVCPFPIDWNDHRRFYLMVGMFKAFAHDMGIKIRVGADFNSDNNLTNDGFIDLPHIELVD